jgi:DNA repair exonuclease SbcCD ATPase subunit
VQPRIKKLTIAGFRSFDGESSVEFPENGLVHLDGRNKDTKGGSGSGKSTVNLAIAYVLGFCSIAGTELRNWRDKTPLKVDLSLDCDGKDVRVKRTSSGLSLWIDGEAVKGGASVCKEVLR